MVSTVEDMTHFIERLLNEGDYSNQEVLKPCALENMLKGYAQFDEVLREIGSGLSIL